MGQCCQEFIPCSKLCLIISRKAIILELSLSTDENLTYSPSILTIINKSSTCSSLLIEVALSDKDFDEEEMKSMSKALINTYDLSKETVLELIDNAKQTVKESTSLYNYTREVNDSFTYDKKLVLIDNLWTIAYADGNLDKFEEHLIRKISDLLYVSHSDFIDIKLKNREQFT